MLKSLEYMNYLLNCNGNLDHTLNGKKVFYISEDILELFKQDLEVFVILLKYIRFEENYKSVDGQSLTFNYDRIILKALNNFDLIGIPLPQVKEKIKDFVIVKNYILTNKVGDNHD